MKLDIILLKDILNDSNYNNITDIKQDISEGHIKIYKNKEAYEHAGYRLDFKECYSLLSNESIAHYVHM